MLQFIEFAGTHYGPEIKSWKQFFMVREQFQGAQSLQFLDLDVPRYLLHIISPNAPIANGTTVVFVLHILLISISDLRISKIFQLLLPQRFGLMVQPYQLRCSA